MEKEQWRRPSEVFSMRLRDTRKARGLSQRALADAVTEAGQRMNKVAVSRLEKGPSERDVSLDEALAFAYVLGVAPAHLLSPVEGELVALTDQAAVDGAGMRNWLLFGDPLLASPEGRRARDRMNLVFAIEGYAQAIIDAKRGGDEAGRLAAADAMQRAIEEHVGFRPPSEPAPPKLPACCPDDLEERELGGNVVLYCPNHDTYYNPHYTERGAS